MCLKITGVFERVLFLAQLFPGYFDKKEIYDQTYNHLHLV